MKKLIIGIAALAVSAQAALAIPAFARKYGYSCEVCHAPIPHLKAFGEQFMGNGYRIPDKEPPRATIDTGDPTLLLQRDVPLAIRFDGFAAYRPNAGLKTDFQAPAAAKILSGGNISESISYYTYFLLAEDGKVAGLEDTYLNFRNVFGLPLDILFGQYRITDPITPAETRLTFEGYGLFKFRLGQSRINLAYDRGVMLSLGALPHTDLIVQVVNGNGIEEPDIFDSDAYKSVVGRIAREFGGLVRVGLLGYSGTEEAESGRTNKVTYLGPDLKIRLPRLELLAEYVRRTDSNPLFLAEAERHTADAFLIEAIISPWGDKGRTFFTVVWNKVHSDLEEASFHTLTLNVNHLLRRNLKAVAEYTRDLERDDHRLLMGIVTAF